MAVERLSSPAFALQLRAGETARLRFEPVRGGVLSWNTHAPSGNIAFRLMRAGQPDGDWIDHTYWTPGGAASHSAVHAGTHVDVDVIGASTPFDGIEVRAPGVDFDLVAFSAPRFGRPSLPYARAAFVVDVPARSQYAEHAQERGWCSPASLAMIHAYHGIDVPVAQSAREVFDRAYNGTGNWSLNVAYSGRLGLRGIVAHFANLDHAQRMIERNVPLAISYSWGEGELPGAPLERSDGHLAVLCGFTANGDCAVNDPAALNVRAVYPRASLERLWQRNHGVAYVVVPAGIDVFDILAS
jgi:hypothetical protein